MTKHAASPAFDDDPWGFGQSDGVLVEVRPEAPVPLDETLTRADLITPSAPALQTPVEPRHRVAAAAIGAAVVASVATAAATWWILQPTEPTPPPGIVSSPPARPSLRPSLEVAGTAAGGPRVAVDAVPALAAPTAAAPSGPSADALAPPSAFGAVAFDAPFDLGVYRQGRFIGAVESTPLRVPAGTHTFELVNERLGFRAWQTLDIVAGQTTRRVVQNRTAQLTLDVRPPAEVVIDGHSYGEVSRADIELALGTRIVVVRHPAFGERTVPVAVALNTPNHVSIDLQP